MNETINAIIGASGGDGADSGFAAGTTMAGGQEVHDLLEAWLVERGRSIESLLILRRVRRLLRRITDSGQFTIERDREAKELLRIIETFESDEHPA